MLAGYLLNRNKTHTKIKAQITYLKTKYFIRKQQLENRPMYFRRKYEKGEEKGGNMKEKAKSRKEKGKTEVKSAQEVNIGISRDRGKYHFGGEGG